MLYEKTMETSSCSGFKYCYGHGGVNASAYAEEAKYGWYLVQGKGWEFYNGPDSDQPGKRAVNKEKMINKKWYAFDEEGWMYSDEAFLSPESDKLGEEVYRYAYPIGELAMGGTGWRKTNDGIWYHISGDPSEIGTVDRGKEKLLDGGKWIYAFNSEGQMFSREWAYLSHDKESGQKKVLEGEEAKDGLPAYYQFEGRKAIDKWLPLDDYWYRFDEEGIVVDVVPVATPSNPERLPVTGEADARIPRPFREAESIQVIGDDEIEAAPGDTVKLKFQVTLASDSNAQRQDFTANGHDIYGSATKSGKFVVKVTDKENGICEVDYTPAMTADETIQLVVDDVYSEPVVIYVKQNTDAKPEETIGNTLDAWEDSSITMDDTREELRQIYEAANDEQKKELQKELLNNEAYDRLLEAYKMNKLIDEKVEVEEEAEALLGEGKVSMKGGALNSDGDEVITLNVKKDDGDKLNQEFKVKIAFDITLSFNDEMVSELNFPVKISMPAPTGIDTAKMQLFHIHDGEEIEIEFELAEGNIVEFYTDQFSTYVFAEEKVEPENPDPENPDPENPDPENPDPENPDPENPGGNSGNGGSSSGGSHRYVPVTTKKTEGQWVLDEIGWWYKNSDGTYPVNEWKQLEYNGTLNWYRFDAVGYMCVGWFTDTDGRIYYLNPVSDGTKGAMKTGWQLIDGYWYYFNTESNGFKGAMFVNTTTPDQCQVNEKGQYIE